MKINLGSFLKALAPAVKPAVQALAATAITAAAQAAIAAISKPKISDDKG